MFLLVWCLHTKYKGIRNTTQYIMVYASGNRIGLGWVSFFSFQEDMSTRKSFGQSIAQVWGLGIGPLFFLFLGRIKVVESLGFSRFLEVGKKIDLDVIKTWPIPRIGLSFFNYWTHTILHIFINTCNFSFHSKLSWIEWSSRVASKHKHKTFFFQKSIWAQAEIYYVCIWIEIYKVLIIP